MTKLYASERISVPLNGSHDPLLCQTRQRLSPQPGYSDRYAISALEDFDQRLAELRRRRRHTNASRFHGGNLVFRAALAAGDHAAGMAHGASGRSRTASDEADHRLLAAALGFVLEELRRIFFSRTADSTDHDDRLGFAVGQEHFQHVDELGALDRIAADTDSGGLAEAFVGGLEHCFIGKRSGAGNNADRTLLEDIARHDAD